jgi:prepilin-type processing-associated H-X9-DG protein
MSLEQRNPVARAAMPLAVFVGLLAASAGAVPSREKTPASVDVADQGLRMARSDDGIRFRDAGPAIGAADAADPSLAQLPDGQLLAIFDVPAGTGRPETVLALSRSRDNGRSWSAPQPLQIPRPRTAHWRPAGGQIVVMPDGTVRLYFVNGHPALPQPVASPGATTPSAPPTIHCAVTRDGVNYRLDEGFQMPPSDARRERPVLLRATEDIHLFLTAVGRDCGGEHWLSADGRRFHPAPGPLPVELAGLRSVVAAGSGYAAYLVTPGGVRRCFSKDARTWTADAGLCVTGPWEPAVTRLRDGSWVMLLAPLPRPTEPPAIAGEPGGDPATDAPPVPGSEKPSPMLVSAHNLRGLATSCWMYAEAHGGHMPPDLETLVRSGLSNARSLVSPLQADPVRPSYTYIPGQTNSMSGENVLGYEDPANHRNNGTWVLFLDGHVAFLKPEELDQRLEQTYSRLERQTK